MTPIKTDALEKLLEHHNKHCSYFVFSGDRHCSCGRNAALLELDVIKKLFSGVQPKDENEIQPTLGLS
jgi:hypothetical protein